MSREIEHNDVASEEKGRSEHEAPEKDPALCFVGVSSLLMLCVQAKKNPEFTGSLRLHRRSDSSEGRGSTLPPLSNYTTTTNEKRPTACNPHCGGPARPQARG